MGAEKKNQHGIERLHSADPHPADPSSSTGTASATVLDCLHPQMFKISESSGMRHRTRFLCEAEDYVVFLPATA
jgi:hypothetical protein